MTTVWSNWSRLLVTAPSLNPFTRTSSPTFAASPGTEVPLSTATSTSPGTIAPGLGPWSDSPPPFKSSSEPKIATRPRTTASRRHRGKHAVAGRPGRPAGASADAAAGRRAPS